MDEPNDQPVVITAAASGHVETEQLWRALAAGAAGRREVNARTRDLPEQIATLAGSALTDGPDPAGTGCVVGSVYGTGHVAETIRGRLDAGARSSLAPESFLCFNAHGVTSLVCLRTGLGGFTATLLGPDAGLQAPAVARRRLRRGDTALLCGAYEVLSPAAAAALGTAETGGWASFLLLETAQAARARGARVLAELGPVRVEPTTTAPDTLPHTDVRATAPIATVAAALADRVGNGQDSAGEITLTAAGRRHAYRCVVRAAA